MTKRILVMAIVLLLAAAITPLLAGGKKCEGDTQGCLNYLAQKLEGRGWAGVDMDQHGEGGPAVTAVFDGTPADRAGVKIGDVLVAINGVRLNEENEAELHELEGMMKPGAEFTYTISCKGKEKELSLKLEQMPAEAVATIVGRHMLEGHATVEMASN